MIRTRSPSSSRLSASRSLWQGTVHRPGRAPPGSARRSARTRRSAAAAGSRARRRCAGSGPARRTCRTRRRTAARRAVPARGCDPVQHRGVVQVGVGTGRDRAGTRRRGPIAGAVVQDRRADPGRGGRHGLACSWSRSMPEQARTGRGDPHHAAAVGVGHLEVAVGQPAGQVLDRARTPRGAGDGVEQRVGSGVEGSRPQLHRGDRRGSRRERSKPRRDLNRRLARWTAQLPDPGPHRRSSGAAWVARASRTTSPSAASRTCCSSSGPS